jgi:hypothetical protein
MQNSSWIRWLLLDELEIPHTLGSKGPPPLALKPRQLVVRSTRDAVYRGICHI